MIDKLATKGNKVLTYLFYTVASLLIVTSAFVIYANIYDQNNAFSTGLENYKPVVIEDGEVPLTKYNAPESLGEDYRAWLTVDNTKIDNPVMQGEDDLYYASHDVFGESMLTGSLYLASGNKRDFSDNYNVLYGHHIDNGAMFGSLDKFLDRGYFNSHQTGQLIVGKKVYKLTIFATIKTDAYDPMVYMPGNRDLNALIYYLRNNNLHFRDGIATSGSKILMMSTCADYQTNGRLAVFAVMEEDPNATVIEPSAVPKTTVWKMPFESPFAVRGNTYKDSWALLNLIALICTLYLVLPVKYLKKKFRRRKMLDETVEEKDGFFEETETFEEAEIRDMIEAQCETAVPDEEEYCEQVRTLYGDPKKFRRKFTIGFIVEILLGIGALILFILTEDMRLPMVIIDEWTPFMLLFLALTNIISIIMIRIKRKYNKNLQYNEDEERNEDEKY